MNVARRTSLAMLPAAVLLGCGVNPDLAGAPPAEVLRIEPAEVTVRQGTSQRFRAYCGAIELDVDWSVRDSRGQPSRGGGTISASGMYVPGTTTGKWFFVHAVSTAAPERAAIARVEVVSGPSAARAGWSAAQAVQTWREARQDGWVLRWSDAASADAERIRDLVALSLQQLSDLFAGHGGDQLWRTVRLTVHVHAFAEDGAGVGTMSIRTDSNGGADLHLLAPGAHGPAGEDGWVPGYDRTYFHKNLVHELSTVFCEQVTRQKGGGFGFQDAPPWFVQGIEEYIGCRLANDDRRLRRYRDAVRGDASRVGPDFDVRDVYGDGCVLVWFLAETLGEAPLLGLLASREPDFWQALQAAAGASRAELNARWQDWLRLDLLSPLGAAEEQRLQQVVDEMIVLVEKHSGLAFAKRPKVRAVKAKEWRDILKRVYRIENALEAFQASGTVGLYLVETDEVVLPPQVVAPLIQEIDEEAPRHVREAVARHKATVVHELVHPLQEQHFSLHSRRAKTGDKDVDEILGLEFVLEGHAVLVEELVAEQELGIEDYMQRGAYGGTGPNLLTQAPTQAVYLTGRRYFLHLLRTGGMKAVLESLAKPPTLAALLELAKQPLPPPSAREPTDSGGVKR